MDIKKEQIVKSRLGLILKVLLIAIALFKIMDYVMSHYSGDNLSSSGGKNALPTVLDSINRSKEGTVGTDENEEGSKAKPKPEPHSASIYIFGANGLDSQTSRHIGTVFFKDYKMSAIPTGFQKEQLLSGNFSSSANTELVCVGTVDYSFKEDGSKNTCELSMNFDTYNKATGEKVKRLSKSMVHYGIGFSDAQAKQVALAKVHP